MNTKQCIQYCIKELDKNPKQQFSFLEGNAVGEEIVIVYRNKGCDGNNYYEYRVATLTEVGWKNHKEKKHMTKKNTKKISAKTVSSKDLKKKIAKKNKHISDMSLQDFSESIMGKLPATMSKINPADVATWKVEQKDYEKYYKLGMKYAREFNKMVLTKRKETVKNKDQQIGWSDGFVEVALSDLYNGIDTFDYEHYNGASLKNET